MNEGICLLGSNIMTMRLRSKAAKHMEKLEDHFYIHCVCLCELMSTCCLCVHTAHLCDDVCLLLCRL